jgi:hypothetical protein
MTSVYILAVDMKMAYVEFEIGSVSIGMGSGFNYPHANYRQDQNPRFAPLCNSAITSLCREMPPFRCLSL